MNLSISADQPTIVPGRTGTQTLTVANSGRPTTGESLVAFSTPAYTNIDRSVPLPAGCTLRYQNQDPTVPEVVNCRIPAGLAADRPVQLAIPLAVTERARLTGPALDAFSVVPTDGSPDTESDFNDNWALSSVVMTRPTPAIPVGNRVGLHLTHDVPVLAADGTATAILRYGNAGPAATVGPVQITFVTPFSTTVDPDRPLPQGCEIVLADRSLATPDVVVCTLPRLGTDQETALGLPLRSEDTGLAGRVAAPALIAPACADDVDTDQTDNMDDPGVLIPRRTT
ncbi:hypothetical protein [Kitasatospora purpeofusca]|uniref:Uncharacterized protein n=1 Tax=Kitasatospora purpeofusca TaxID=67352 RepID=A0ABZ1U8Q6_9ACTN|nr:hypothetical protein [Kitasatospora purpeofusca]